MHVSAKSESQKPANIQGRSIAILGISPVRALDLIGPGEVFMEANRLNGRTFYQLTFLSGAKDTSILSPLALSFTAGSSFLDADMTFDTLLVAGGNGALGPLYDPVLLGWIQRKALSVRAPWSLQKPDSWTADVLPPIGIGVTSLQRAIHA